MLGILWRNLFGYDLIIFAAAIVNLILFIKIQKGVGLIEERFKQTKHLQNELLVEKLKLKGETSLSKKMTDILNLFTDTKHQLDQVSVFYVSLTSIFPLLGILGTVVALLSLSDFNNDIVSLNFSLALSSTFWGIFFGALSKFGEGFFTAKLDYYDKLYHEVRTNLIALGDDHE